MTGGRGHFDSFGNACAKFHLCGIKHDEPGLEYTGIIDTGFTGFVQLPIQYAFSLGLPLDGTVSVTLADGTRSVCLTAIATTTFQTTVGTKKEVGVVILEPNATEILIGMDFLRTFNLGLFVTKRGVLLISEEFLEKFYTVIKKRKKIAVKGKKAPRVKKTTSASSAPKRLP